MDANDLYENNPSGNLLKGIDLGRLSQAVKADRMGLEPYRANRMEFVRQHVGSYYGHGGTHYEVPLPLVSTYLSTYSRALVAKEPRVSLSTFVKSAMPAVDAMQSWLNDHFEEIDLGDPLRRAVFDALVSEARIKVCLTMPELAEAAYGSEAGQPGVYTIDEDDWVCDTRARCEREWSYCGHSYRIPLKVAKDIFRKRNLTASEPTDHNRDDGLEKIFTVGAGLRANKDELEDHVELWEIHVKGRFDVVLTLLDHDGIPSPDRKGLLRVRRYLGPKGGNVYSLGYGTVPGNLRPVSPVMGLMPLHLAINRSYRKLIDTADNFKAVPVVRSGSTGGDGKALKNARHMEMIATDNPADVGEVVFNRPSAELERFTAGMMAAFDQIGGGLRALSGAGVSAPTATQEKLVGMRASAGVGDLQDTTVAWVGRAVRGLCWYLWNHPENVYTTSKKLPGLADTMMRQLHPDNDELPNHPDVVASGGLRREGPLPRIKVDPFSLQHLGPTEKSQLVSAILAEFAPYGSIMASQGVVIDVAEALKLKAKYHDEPDLLKVFKDQGPPEPAVGEAAGEGATLDKDQPMRPAQTERTYNRISTAGGEREQTADRMKELMAASADGGGGFQGMGTQAG